MAIGVNGGGFSVQVSVFRSQCFRFYALTPDT